MQVKRNLLHREPTEEEKLKLQFPVDKFELISVDYVDEWDKLHAKMLIGGKIKQHVQRVKAVHITVRCRKCGHLHKEVTDRAGMSCKYGPCSASWIDLTGKRFGRLLVTGLSYRRAATHQSQARWYWECKCDCGNVCYRTAPSLQHSLNAACPKCAFSTAVSKTTLPNRLSKWRRMIRIYKKNAMRYGRVFKITEEQFIETALKPCAYCGSAPEMSSYGVVCNGIDRIDNNRGYEIDNITACCHWCNLMKGKHTKNSFFQHIIDIYNHCGLKFNDHPEREYPSSDGEVGADQI